MSPKSKLPRVELPPRPDRIAREFTHARVPGTLKRDMLMLAQKLGETETQFLETAIRERLERLTTQSHNPNLAARLGDKAQGSLG